MDFARLKKGIFVNQRKYILHLFDETWLLGYKAIDTQLEPNVKLSSTNLKDVIDRDKFQRLVGRLIYLSHTSLDIAFALSMIS